MVKEKKHLQKIHYYDQGHTKCCQVPSKSYDLTKGTQNVVKCPPNHMTFEPAKFEIATSNSLVENALTRKYII